MNGPQDLGGRDGFGPVVPEANEPVFHADWERQTLALTIACGSMGHWNIDESRHARECLPPAIYYRSGYYEIWIRALEALLLRHGFVSAEELASGSAGSPGATPRRILQADDVVPAMKRGGPVNRPEGDQRPAFSVGDPVRTRLMHRRGHTRLPAYATGRVGRISAIQGFHVFPDSNAHGGGEQPQWLYAVVFGAHDLWGEDADPNQTVAIDAWESYLDQV